MTGLAIAFNIALVLAVVLALSSAGRLFGPRPRHEGDAELPYETGVRPFGPAVDHMAVLYFRYALLFVVFDVDLAFLLPWALNRSALDLQSVVCVTVFVGTLALMLAYFWSKGLLECR